MEQAAQTHEGYDYRQYDCVWQRVNPGMEAYPAVRGATPPQSGLPGGPNTPELGLLGAQADPCCMGSAAAEMLEVLVGFIEEELSDRRYFMAMSRIAPTWAKQKLRDLAAEEYEHARRLMAVYYLITGECYRPPLAARKFTSAIGAPPCGSAITAKPATV